MSKISATRKAVALAAAVTMTAGTFPTTAFADELPEEVVVTQSEAETVEKGQEETEFLLEQKEKEESAIDKEEQDEEEQSSDREQPDEDNNDDNNADTPEDAPSDEKENDDAQTGDDDESGEDGKVGNDTDNIVDDTTALCEPDEEEKLHQTGDEIPYVIGGGIAAALIAFAVAMRRKVRS